MIIIPNIWKNKNVPNHQPEYIISIFCCRTCVVSIVCVAGEFNKSRPSLDSGCIHMSPHASQVSIIHINHHKSIGTSYIPIVGLQIHGLSSKVWLFGLSVVFRNIEIQPAICLKTSKKHGWGLANDVPFQQSSNV